MTSSTPRGPEEVQDQEVKALLEERATRLRGRADGTADETVLMVAEFPLGEERYAIPLESLRAALPLRLVTPVPLSMPHVIGVLRYQGQVLAALSLAALMGGHGWRQDPAVLLVLDRGDGELCALDCEAIPRPLSLPTAAVEAARTQAEGAVVEVPLKNNRQIIHLIDLPRLFARGAGARNAG
ncbi:chemotaxis protein CheW [Archangium violaceum]|jgi:chemotaxis signal transduction protein|uniref:chemotaxis protein CheW n=1 Tax=Archangium violaceum TaxID=83451 RepID=UPI00194DFDB3|nr:chemotaxis protein CheW [Archangium violaceum]QRN99275.1 chemotaxis protein CheW [Archangium violaceum]